MNTLPPPPPPPPPTRHAANAPTRHARPPARVVGFLTARVVKVGKDSNDPKTCLASASAFLSAHSALSIASRSVSPSISAPSSFGRKDTPRSELTRRNSAAMRNASKESGRRRGPWPVACGFDDRLPRPTYSPYYFSSPPPPPTTTLYPRRRGIYAFWGWGFVGRSNTLPTFPTRGLRHATPPRPTPRRPAPTATEQRVWSSSPSRWWTTTRRA